MNKRKLYSLNLCDQENPLVVVWMKTCTNLNSTEENQSTKQATVFDKHEYPAFSTVCVVRHASRGTADCVLKHVFNVLSFCKTLLPDHASAVSLGEQRE